MSKQGFIYILSNIHNTTLYLGVTNDLKRRVSEHKLHINSGFTDKYNIEKLMYFEIHEQIYDAIQREKQLKKWRREWKDALINDHNPDLNPESWTKNFRGFYVQKEEETHL